MAFESCEFRLDSVCKLLRITCPLSAALKDLQLQWFDTRPKFSAAGYDLSLVKNSDLQPGQNSCMLIFA